MDERVFFLLAKVFAGIVSALTVAFIAAFLILPPLLPEYEPKTDLTTVTSAAITTLGAFLTGFYLKSRRARSEDGEDKPDGDENDQ